VWARWACLEDRRIGPVGKNSGESAPLPWDAERHYPTDPDGDQPRQKVEPYQAKDGRLAVRARLLWDPICGSAVKQETWGAAATFAASGVSLDLIVADPVPEIGLGRAIMDRLRRASRKPEDSKQ
jgi:hypothetical protein